MPAMATTPGFSPPPLTPELREENDALAIAPAALGVLARPWLQRIPRGLSFALVATTALLLMLGMGADLRTAVLLGAATWWRLTPTGLSLLSALRPLAEWAQENRYARLRQMDDTPAP